MLYSSIVPRLHLSRGNGLVNQVEFSWAYYWNVTKTHILLTSCDVGRRKIAYQLSIWLSDWRLTESSAAYISTVVLQLAIVSLEAW